MQCKKDLLFCTLTVGLMAAMLFSTGCSNSEPAGPGSSGADKKAESTYTIGMSQCNLGEQWRVEMNAEIAVHAAKNEYQMPRRPHL